MLEGKVVNDVIRLTELQVKVRQVVKRWSDVCRDDIDDAKKNHFKSYKLEADETKCCLCGGERRDAEPPADGS